MSCKNRRKLLRKRRSMLDLRRLNTIDFDDLVIAYEVELVPNYYSTTKDCCWRRCSRDCSWLLRGPKTEVYFFLLLMLFRDDTKLLDYLIHLNNKWTNKWRRLQQQSLIHWELTTMIESDWRCHEWDWLWERLTTSVTRKRRYKTRQSCAEAAVKSLVSSRNDSSHSSFEQMLVACLVNDA